MKEVLNNSISNAPVGKPWKRGLIHMLGLMSPGRKNKGGFDG